jgi:hypothetical protein
MGKLRPPRKVRRPRRLAGLCRWFQAFLPFVAFSSFTASAAFASGFTRISVHSAVLSRQAAPSIRSDAPPASISAAKARQMRPSSG